MFSKKKNEKEKDEKKEDKKDKKGDKSDKSDKEKDKHSTTLSHSASDIHSHKDKVHHKKDKEKEKDKEKAEKDKEKDKVSTKANGSKPSLAISTKSNKDINKPHHGESTKKFKKSSSAPVFTGKNELEEQPEVVDDDLYDFLCDPTKSEGPKLKFKSPGSQKPDITPLGQLKRAGSDKSQRSSRQSSSRSFSFS